MERSGNWLFRWRSYLPLLLILPILLAMRQIDSQDHPYELGILVDSDMRDESESFGSYSAIRYNTNREERPFEPGRPLAYTDTGYVPC